jgi:hypothetical protein
MRSVSQSLSSDGISWISSYLGFPGKIMSGCFHEIWINMSPGLYLVTQWRRGVPTSFSSPAFVGFCLILNIKYWMEPPL